MAKHIFPYTLLGLALLSSCSQYDDNDTNNLEKGRITFRTALPEITSRAAEVTKDNITKFQVSSFVTGTTPTTYFTDKTFNKNCSTGNFICYDPECIWPNNNDVLKFIAFSPSCEEMKEAAGEDAFKLPELKAGDELADADNKLSNFKVPTDIASHFDFATATGTGTLKDNEDIPIDLNFHHQLSRIELKAYGASPSYSIEIAGVRLGGITVGGDFNFITSALANEATGEGGWNNTSKGYVDYIYREGDKILSIIPAEGKCNSADKAEYILKAITKGAEGRDNSAMVLPTASTGWDYTKNPNNEAGEGKSEEMYFSVLLRITDTTPYVQEGKEIAYPYADKSKDMKEVVYFAVDADNTVVSRVYMNDDGAYFTDKDCTVAYTGNATVKGFAWAAMPVVDKWEAGNIYTYTLNYTNGVGLRAPDDNEPGTPIISDKVLINVEVTDWVATDEKEETVPRR